VPGDRAGDGCGEDRPRCRPSTLLPPLVLAGGGVLDGELLRTVGESLRSIPIGLERADIDGMHGPRFAVSRGWCTFTWVSASRGERTRNSPRLSRLKKPPTVCRPSLIGH
jgi:hypothetical protein